nr:DUF2200 domain-containing protein [uncultured Acetatifactor sp.]
MKNEKIYGMAFGKLYPMLIAKAERKGRTRAEVDEVTGWLTGYSKDRLAELMESDITYGDFFLQAPALNPERRLIKGVVCGVRVEDIEEPLMQEIRYLDKLVDELARGRRWRRFCAGDGFRERGILYIIVFRGNYPKPESQG